MSTSEAPPAPKKSLTLQCAEAIVAGDLDAVKKLRPNGRLINAVINTLPATLVPKPKYTTSGRVPVISRPTLFIWAILCEQVEIMEYLISHAGADFRVTSGQPEVSNALHVAAHVHDPRPLQLLLEYRWFQEHVDIPIERAGAVKREGFFTTALHIAVTQRNIPHVFLLLTKRGTWRDLPGAASAEAVACEPANVNQRASSSGSTPLHIAVAAGNVAAVRVLLAHGAETGLPNADGKSAAQVAEAMKGAKPTLLYRATPAERAEVLRRVENAETDTEAPEDLLLELAPSIAPKIDVAGDGDAEPPQKDDDVRDLLREVMRSLRSLEREVRGLAGARAVAPGAAAPIVQGGAAACVQCGAAGAQCAQCHGAYCGVCNDKPAHACARRQ
jgi:hypothetical protein